MTESRRFRTLVAEDSPTARALLVEVLGSDSGLEVVGEAANGLEAVELTVRLKPDVVTMDVRMPVMDGLAATEEIMTVAPTPIVIVSGSFDRRDVELSMNALRAGALAVLPKPSGPAAPGFSEECRQLVATVKSMAAVKVVRRWRGRSPVEPTPRSIPRSAPPAVVAMAASTGGPAALQRILSSLPADFPVPVLVVQHIAAGFVGGLTDWLDAASFLRVKVADDGEPLLAGTAYLAPDGRDLGVSDRGRASLTGPRTGNSWSSATSLFDSVANAYGSSTLAVILTGMGRDGLAGLLAVKRAGGRVIAQDEETSVVFGMPGAAVEAGVADLVLPLGSIGPTMVELTRESSRRRP